MASLLLVVCAVGRSQSDPPAVSAPLAASPAQMLEMANQALATGHPSPVDRSRLLLRRGLAHELLGQRNEAVADFTGAISTGALAQDEQAGAFYDRGVTLDELNRADDAIADYTAALMLQPRFAAALNNRANIYRRLGRLAEACQDYEDSVTAGNGNLEFPEYGMGMIAEALNQPAAAREYYRAALRANPQYVLASRRLAALTEDTENVTAINVPPRAPDSTVQAVARPPPSLPDGTEGLKPAIDDFTRVDDQFIQLGAWRSEGEAKQAWNRLQGIAAAILGGKAPVIVPVDLPGKGRYFRLRVAQPDTRSASRSCAALKAGGQACILVPH